MYERESDKAAIDCSIINVIVRHKLNTIIYCCGEDVF